MNGFNGPRHLLFLKEDLNVYTYADLKTSLYGHVQVNIIPSKFHILNPKNNSRILRIVKYSRFIFISIKNINGDFQICISLTLRWLS